MRKISEILRQHYDLKLTYREIARSQNISTSTVSSYVWRARLAGIANALPAGITEEELYKLLFLPAKENSTKRTPPDWEMVHQELRRKGMTLRLLWREYRDQYADGLGYTQFCKRYRQHQKTISPVMHQVHKAGEKTFVDYAGMMVPWIDLITGEIKEAQIFIGCLGASQFMFVEATATQQLPDWIQSHVRMWEYFGGVTEIVVPDNLKAGVTTTHRYDPDINANYQLLGEHYGFAIVPARVREPKDKAKVENAVGITERQILAAMRQITFTSIAEINAAIKPRLAALNQQSFQKMKTSRKNLFETVDKPTLKPLPPEKYHYAEWQKAKIHIDYHFVFDNHHYSVPYKHIHQEVELCATSTIVECYYQGKRIASHVRSYKQYQYTTLKEHMPKAHLVHAQWSPERMKRWASKIGEHTTRFIDRLIESRAFPQQGYRACLGILRLGSRYGEDRLEKACALAYQAGVTRYKQVELILKNKLDAMPHSRATSTPIVASHENIRGSDYYK